LERDSPSDADTPKPALTLVPQDGADELYDAVKDATGGRFVFNTVYPARYRLKAISSAAGHYVASVYYGDTDVTAQAFQITNPPLTIRVVERRGAARVTGSVEDCAGGRVVLVPEDDSMRGFVAHTKTARCDANGRFSMESLRPGGYYAFAFDRVHEEMLEDNAFVRRIAPGAARVELKHGETKNIELRRQAWPDY
jgi:hypothetical protein